MQDNALIHKGNMT